MSKLLNLDKIVQEDKEIILGGSTYTIPHELCLESMLSILKTSQRIQDTPNDVEGQEEAIKAVYNVFKIRKNNMMPFDDFKKIIGLNQYMQLVNFILGGLEDAEKKTALNGLSEEPKPDAEI